MKLLATCFLMMALALDGQTSMFGEKYDELDLSEVLINADRILVCVPVYDYKKIREDDDRRLCELQDVNPIPELGADVHNSTERLVVVVSPGKRGFGFPRSPILLNGKRQLVFLKKMSVDDQFRTKYETGKSEEIFQLCNMWQAAICLDFSVEGLARNILKKKYGLDDPDTFLDVVRNLSRWRMAGCNKEEAIQDLLSLLNSDKSEIYQENIPKILRHLGASVVKKDNQFIIQKKDQETRRGSVTTNNESNCGSGSADSGGWKDE